MSKRKVTAWILAGSMLLGSVTLTGCGTDTPERCIATRQTEQETVSSNETQGLEAENSAYDVEDSDACFWAFSKQLFGEQLSETNPVLSPLSAYLAMGMISLGAKGETLEELEEVLGQGTDMTGIRAASRVWLEHIPTVGNIEKLPDEEGQLIVSLANSAWVDQDLEPDNNWLTEVEDIYGAEVFRGTLSEKSTMKAINDWVEKKTNSLIQGFLEKPLPESCRLALFNTIYFDGTWVQEFKPTATYKDDFYVDNATCGVIDQVEMMHDYERRELYVQNTELDGVVMPYRDGNMVLVALKPTAGQSVREMYDALTYETLMELLEQGEERLMNLKLPKFEVTFDKELNESLQNMGIEKAFDAAWADFSGLGTTALGNSLYIDLVRQKAVVKLNEKGTEAAAVTMVAVSESAAMEMPKQEQPIDVFFDSPFLYMIMDMEYKVPLFMGIMDFPET